MTTTKTKDFAKIFAIIAGFFFLICGLIKIVYAVMPMFSELLSYFYFNYSYYILYGIEFSIITVIETLSLFSLSALCFSCKRSNALVIPVVSLATVGVYSFISGIWNDLYAIGRMIMGGSSYVSYNTTNAVFILLSLIALFFLFVLICVNVSMKKGIVPLIVLAVLAVGNFILAYVACCIGDVLVLVMSSLSRIFAYDFIAYLVYMVLMPLINNLAQLVFVVAALFMSIWLIFRPKTVEVTVETKKEKKARKEAEKAEKKAEKAAKKAAKAAKDAEEAANQAGIEPETVVAEVTLDEVENADESDPMEIVAEETE